MKKRDHHPQSLSPMRGSRTEESVEELFGLEMGSSRVTSYIPVLSLSLGVQIVMN